MAFPRAVYRPRDAEHTVLHQVVAEHLEAFLGAVAEAGDGSSLPQFVEREFREFLACGVFESGVARFRCEGCAREHFVPFSCKGRGFCPSCGVGASSAIASTRGCHAGRWPSCSSPSKSRAARSFWQTR